MPRCRRRDKSRPRTSLRPTDCHIEQELVPTVLAALWEKFFYSENPLYRALARHLCYVSLDPGLILLPYQLRLWPVLSQSTRLRAVLEALCAKMGCPSYRLH